MRIVLIMLLVLITIWPLFSYNRQAHIFVAATLSTNSINYQTNQLTSNPMANSWSFTLNKLDRLRKNDIHTRENYIDEFNESELALTKENRGEKISILLDVELISQMPELPRGCEVTSLAMLLNFAGINVEKIELAQELKKVPYMENGFYGNPNDGFVGDMYTYENDGYGVYHEPIFELGSKYIPNKIIDLTGNELDYVLEFLHFETPIWVIVNTWFTYIPDEYWETWETSSGEIKITRKEHSVLITGFDGEYVYFNDPLSNVKNSKVLKVEFEKAYNQMGKQAITYLKY